MRWLLLLGLGLGLGLLGCEESDPRDDANVECYATDFASCGKPDVIFDICEAEWEDGEYERWITAPDGTEWVCADAGCIDEFNDADRYCRDFL